MKGSALSIFLGLVAAACLTAFFMQRQSVQRLTAQLNEIEARLSSETANRDALQDKLKRAEEDRDKFQRDAAEVHRLRGEISALRTANKTLEQQAAQARANKAVAPKEPVQTQAAPPSQFASYSEMGKFVGGLRAKAFGAGPLTPEERQYLDKLKPELEKLERSPAEFASFQAELIQAAAGISDPQKVDRIRQGIQKVYENAVARGLDLPSRQPDDLNWVERRFQLDRRGTQAVHSILSEEERAAFDRQFLGVMGVDLGTGVDKSLYPKGFLGEGDK